MIFKVYAGTIFCGILRVSEITGIHIFINHKLEETFAFDEYGRIRDFKAVAKVTGYKRLELRRVA